MGEAWEEDAMRQRKGVDEERTPARASCRNEWRRVKACWDEFFFFLFNDEKSRGSSLAGAVGVGPPP